MARVIYKSLITDYEEHLKKAIDRAENGRVVSQITKLLRPKTAIMVTHICDDNFTTVLS